MAGGANMYLYRCVSLLAPECDVCACVTSNQSTSKKTTLCVRPQ